MKRVVYVIEVDVPESFNDPFVSDIFGKHLVTWGAYFPEEDGPPIRLNISYDGVDEV